MPKVHEAKILRERSAVDGTFGRLTLDYGGDNVFTCWTLELPWKANAPRVSCIPEGVYNCVLRKSPRFGKYKYTLEGVPGRAGILFHAGNTAGDEAAGLLSDVQGCILLGLDRGSLHGQLAVLDSAAAVKRFEDLCGGADVRLTIEWKDS